MAEGETVLMKRHLDLAMSSFGVLSAVAGVLQLIQQGPPEAKAVVSLFISIALIAFTAFVFVPPCYSSICTSVSFFFAVLTSASVLPDFLPNILKWVPYLSCLLPLFDLLPTNFQLYAQQLSSSAWNAGSVAARKVLDMASRPPLQALHNASSATSMGIPGELKSSSSAASRMEEGNASTPQ